MDLGLGLFLELEAESVSQLFPMELPPAAAALRAWFDPASVLDKCYPSYEPLGDSFEPDYPEMESLMESVASLDEDCARPPVKPAAFEDSPASVSSEVRSAMVGHLISNISTPTRTNTSSPMLSQCNSLPTRVENQKYVEQSHAHSGKYMRAQAIYRLRIKKAKRYGLGSVIVRSLMEHSVNDPENPLSYPFPRCQTFEKIKYARRSKAACTRPRVRGRFVPKE